MWYINDALKFPNTSEIDPQTLLCYCDAIGMWFVLSNIPAQHCVIRFLFSNEISTQDISKDYCDTYTLLQLDSCPAMYILSLVESLKHLTISTIMSSYLFCVCVCLWFMQYLRESNYSTSFTLLCFATSIYPIKHIPSTCSLISMPHMSYCLFVALPSAFIFCHFVFESIPIFWWEQPYSRRVLLSYDWEVVLIVNNV